MSPSQIGLRTGNWRDGGRIELDEDRLRAALEENPDLVNDIFNSTERTGTDDRRGLTWRMDQIMGDFMSGSGSRSLRSLEQSIARENQRIERLEIRMWQEEERLHRQFAAMETAMGRMQQQGDWFAAMLGHM